MILERIENIGQALLDELVQNRTPESATLEFKRALPGKSPDDKREFQKDVCAMANHQGGDIVYGIAEKEGMAAALMPITDVAADATMRRLGQILESGVEPRVNGLRMQAVSVAGGYVLILRIPQSFIGPHCYALQATSPFPIRNETHVGNMTYEQLRTAFDRTATLAERARAFRAERLDAIERQQTPGHVADGPAAIVHIVPISAMTGQSAIDIQAAFEQSRELSPKDSGGRRQFNLDGVLTTATEANGSILEYVQVFRSGAIEAFAAHFTMDRNGKRVIPSLTLAQFVRAAIARTARAPARFGVRGAAILGLSVLHVHGHVFGTDRRYMRGELAADRPILVLPEHWIENLEAFDTDDIARPLLDVLWQCFDLPRCDYFDEAGKWSTAQ